MAGGWSMIRAGLARMIAPKAEGGVKISDLTGMSDLLDMGTSSASVTVNETTAMRLSVAMACVRLLSSVQASLDLKVERRDGVTWVPEPDHPVQRFLDSPNAMYSAYMFLEMLAWRLHTDGDGLAVLRRSGSMRPAEALIIDRSHVSRVFRGSDRRLKYQLVYPDATGSIRNEVLDQDFILHVPGPGFDGLLSPSPIRHYAREALGLALAAQTHQSKMFANGARPSGTIEFPEGVSDEAVQATKENWQAAYAGLENVGKVAPLYSGAKFNPITFSSADSELLASRQFSVEDVARVWGVPLHMIGANQKSTSWGQGIQEQTIGFIRYVLGPHIARVEHEFGRKLFRDDERARYRVRVDSSSLMRGTPAEHANMLEVLVQKAAIITPNEARARLGEQPIDGGDELRQPSGAPVQSSAPNLAPEPEPDDD